MPIVNKQPVTVNEKHFYAYRPSVKYQNLKEIFLMSEDFCT
jgi:hypothetical protein